MNRHVKVGACLVLVGKVASCGGNTNEDATAGSGGATDTAPATGSTSTSSATGGAARTTGPGAGLGGDEADAASGDSADAPGGASVLGAAGTDTGTDATGPRVSPDDWVYRSYQPWCDPPAEDCFCPTCDDLGDEPWAASCEVIVSCYQEHCSISGPGMEGYLACADEDECPALVSAELEAFPEQTQAIAKEVFYAVFRAARYGVCVEID